MSVFHLGEGGITQLERAAKKGIQSNNPQWWTIHKRIKHFRTGMNHCTGKTNEKDGTQENVLYALAVLYIINAYIVNIMCVDTDDKTAKYFLSKYYDSSKLFNCFLVSGPL